MKMHKEDAMEMHFRQHHLKVMRKLQAFDGEQGSVIGTGRILN